MAWWGKSHWKIVKILNTLLLPILLQSEELDINHLYKYSTPIMRFDRLCHSSLHRTTWSIGWGCAGKHVGYTAEHLLLHQSSGHTFHWFCKTIGLPKFTTNISIHVASTQGKGNQHNYSPLELEWKDCNEKEDGPKNWEGHKCSPEDPHFNWRHSTLKTTLSSFKYPMTLAFIVNVVPPSKANHETPCNIFYSPEVHWNK